ncbi:phosphoenolpyruvate carboxykinase (ATP) [Alkalicoccus halolimnae]|uniref:Phosphoenolpyruvate carboxykinase (ATP) n=1 Tax=Alkalicoccus halolimnae TaxID=1667239 RepID=A0A5C7F1I6_9BACI|nr:phosphoenolpyruvate carboxykinase (ATP) [Alkalicoccus halolimnae]TXF81991.1 phosphoenolpyruvate carboxykinase (ATP) [Alkalicoccus halolimnae]
MSMLHDHLQIENLLKQSNIHRQLTVPQLVETALNRHEGTLTSDGAFRAVTGDYTGRSPKDRFIVDEDSITNEIDWGAVNQPIPPDIFDRLEQKVMAYLAEQPAVFYRKAFAGADSRWRLPVDIINEYAWHQLFAHQLFLRPEEIEGEAALDPFTILSAPGFKADPERDGTRSEAFVIISFEKRTILIGGTAYAGEMKKAIFSIMNYLLPSMDVLPMHCSANADKDGNTALFFGLSGTGKTTLSATDDRMLIGDDEHGWSKDGVFNFEGGCYAKCIGLHPDKEPEIFHAVRFGTVLENVKLKENRTPDYESASLTENTRAAYPLTAVPSAKLPSTAGHPEVILFLTADATGVLPPISRLNRSQAMYHFLSGYTSKLAGTERGVTEPQPVFSPCFGAPFLPRDPSIYAKMLGEKIDQHEAEVYLVNTGWTGGAYGTGSRMDLRFTRAMVRAAINGDLKHTSSITDAAFGLEIPATCPNVPPEVLQPRLMWDNISEYEAAASALADKFHANFTRFKNVTSEILRGGPVL